MVTFSGLNLHIFKALDPTEGTYHSGVNVSNHEATTDVMADAEQTCGTRNAETRYLSGNTFYNYHDCTRTSQSGLEQE